MNKWLELLIGLILVIAPILAATAAFGYPGWWSSAYTVLKGGVFWAILGLGVLFILLGISDLKDAR